jgi:membrane protease subunit HflK
MTRKRKKSFETNKILEGGYFWLLAVVALLTISFVYGTVYTIPTGHRGVVLRFGKYSRIVVPGLHFKIPFGVDKVWKVHTDKVQTETFGFRSVSAGIRSQREKDLQAQRESLMVTSDLNVIDVEWIVQYRREDPRKYLFNLQDPVRAIRDISESVIRRILGDRSFDYVLQNREQVNRMAEHEIQAILDAYQTGIRVVDVRLQNVLPPDTVREAFNEVNEAQQEKERLINQAQETYNREVPKARGEAERTVNSARGYALGRVNRARGDVARFSAILKEYRNAKRVTKRRLYLETFQTILPNAKGIYVIDSEQKSIVPLLQPDRQDHKGGEAR